MCANFFRPMTTQSRDTEVVSFEVSGQWVNFERSKLGTGWSYREKNYTVGTGLTSGFQIRSFLKSRMKNKKIVKFADLWSVADLGGKNL